MRFPWLQVDSDFLEAAAGDLGVLLDISRREAIGMMTDLWAWALTRSPKDRAPDGIVAGTGAVSLLLNAADWSGEPERLLSAMERVGVLERLEDGFRFRGMGRYRSTWEKNRRRKPNRQKTGAVPGRNRSETGAKTQTQTQTDTQKQPVEDLAGSPTGSPLVSEVSADDLPQADPEDVVDDSDTLRSMAEAPVLPGQLASRVLAANYPAKPESSPVEGPHILGTNSPPPLRLEPQVAAKKARRLSDAEALYQALQQGRRVRCEQAGLPCRDDGWAAARQNKTLGPLTEARLGKEAYALLEAGWAEYLTSDDGARLDLPWSLSVFMLQRARWESKAMRGGT